MNANHTKMLPLTAIQRLKLFKNQNFIETSAFYYDLTGLIEIIIVFSLLIFLIYMKKYKFYNVGILGIIHYQHMKLLFACPLP